MEEIYVPIRECVLHREVIEAKLEACERRVDGILEEIKEVRQLQKNIQYWLIYISVGISLTLLGVILGRTFDIGWILP